MTRIIAITSGKGGVGKTNISLNMALHLAARGYRTGLFDADLGLANINVLLGLFPEYTLEDVILNRRAVKDIIIRDYEGIDIIPGSSGVEKMANLDDAHLDRLLRSFSDMDGYDFFILDTSAGISRQVISFCLSSSEVILVVTPEPTSLTDGYAMIKILSQNGFKSSVKVLINQCATMAAAKSTYTKLSAAVERYIGLDLLPIGVILQDSRVEEAVRKQQPFLLLFPDCAASRGIKNMVQRLIDNKPEDLESLGLLPFWTRWIKTIKAPLSLGNRKEGKQDAPEREGGPKQQISVPMIKEPQQSSKPDKTDDTRDSTNLLPESREKEIVPTRSDHTEPSNGEVNAPPGTSIQLSLLQEMSRLNEGITGVSRELQLLRETIEGGRTRWVGASSMLGERTKAAPSAPIPLDLEAFLKRSGINIKNN
jgi:flagellar biosynthesis protein FlhG